MSERQNGDQNGVWSRYLRDRESIWRVFRDFRDREDPVTLRFESVDTLYTAGVRDVDHRRVTLENIHPRSGETLMNNGRAFALTGRSGGAYVYAPQNQCVGSAAVDGANVFLVELPAEMLWQQRRRGPRFPVPASLRSGRARITLAAHGGIGGAIEDISAAGCRAVFAAETRDALSSADTFDDAQVEIAGLLAIRARIAVRHRVVDDNTGAVTCGLEFTRMSGDDRARLEQFLRSLAKRAANN